ncbi:MAG: prolipoprotein diacylglyceryl transferase [Acidobacteria bacterium]|nr:prolipoprotein diacylglyceryl transferase [Acidobacteriota bacterium]
MFPKIIQIGSFVIPTYGLLVAAGFVAGIVISIRLAQREGLSKEKIYNLGIYLALAGMIGSKLFLLWQDRAYYWDNPRQLFSLSVLQSGGIFYGGLLVAIGVAVWFAHRNRIRFVKLGDVFAPGVALGHAFGRIGCFSAGCCWGKPTSLPWGVTFEDPYSHEIVGVPLGIKIHPTQLYEAVAEALIFVVLYFQYRRKRFDGQILGWYLLLYPTVRFLIEFLRSHEGPGEGMFWGRLSDAQAVSIVLIATGVWLLWLGPYRRRAATPVAATLAPASHGHTRRAAKLSGR